MLTVDRNIKHQQNLAALPLAVVVLLPPTIKLTDLIPLLPAVEDAFKSLQPCALIEVAPASP